MATYIKETGISRKAIGIAAKEIAIIITEIDFAGQAIDISGRENDALFSSFNALPGYAGIACRESGIYIRIGSKNLTKKRIIIFGASIHNS